MSDGRVLAFVIAVLGACVEPSLTSCPAVDCPVGRVCDGRGGCAFPEQLATCASAADGAACSYPGTENGSCTNGICEPIGCGNGVTTADEHCDDGNTVNGDGCSADCRSGETCGNAAIDPARGEQCDDGNVVDGDGCQHDCQLPRCGDGVIDIALSEGCDGGVANSNSSDAACRTTCQLRRCGDGIVDGAHGEVCDDGNVAPGDGCTPDCLSNETCGNGKLDYFAGERCDDHNTRNLDGCAPTCQPEPRAWRQLGTAATPTNWGATIPAYDAARGVVVAFGGSGLGFAYQDDTYELVDGRWTIISPPTRPTARVYATLTYDAVRHRIVMFGGSLRTHFSEVATDETWTYDGIDWTQLHPAHAPPARRTPGLAFDAARGHVVMYGGDVGDTKTWELVGDDWVGTQTTDSPPTGYNTQLSYDPVRARTVLLLDTSVWEYDGTNWSQATDAPASGLLAFDPTNAGIVVMTGDTLYVQAGPTWTAVQLSPPPAGALSLLYDERHDRMITAGPEPWAADGDATWKSLAPTNPDARADFAFTYDDALGATVLLSGYQHADMWTLDQRDIWHLSPAPPEVLERGAAGYDTMRRRIIVEGGSSNTTYSVDELGWTAIATGVYHGFTALAYDVARDRMVLFGGGPVADHGETWELDGDTWSQRTDVIAPRERDEPGLVYDAAHHRVVMFGGHTYNEGEFDDTWSYDGTAWTPINSVVSPLGRTHFGMVYDSIRGVVVLSGGIHEQTTLYDTWELDGDVWTRIDQHAPISVVRLAFDPRTASLVTFDRDGTTWRYAYAPLAPREVCRAGIDYDADGAVACADDDCAVACASCGDARCDPVETARLCPADCPVVTLRCGDFYCDPPETHATCPGDCP